MQSCGHGSLLISNGSTKARMTILINTAIHRGVSGRVTPVTVSTVFVPGDGKRLKPLRT